MLARTLGARVLLAGAVTLSGLLLGIVGSSGASTTGVVVTAGSVDVLASSHSQDADIPVSLSAPSSSPLVVRWTVVGGTAVLGRDVSSGSGLLHFSGSTTESFVAVRVLPARTASTRTCWYQGGTCLTYSMQLKIESGTGSIGVGSWSDAIIWPSSRPRTSVGAGDTLVSLAAGQTSAVARIPVSLSRTVDAPVTVRYDTESASAQPGLQYTAERGVVRIARGTASSFVSIPIPTKDFTQPFEVVLVALSSPQGAQMSRATGVVILATPGVGVASPVAAGYSSATLTQIVSSTGQGDTYGVSAAGSNSDVLASGHIAQANDRVVYWPSTESAATDSQACATWTLEAPTQQQGSLIQEGLAVRVGTKDGITRAITLTKNVYGQYFDQINVHVWSTSERQPFRLIGGFNIASYLKASDPASLPLNVCLRVTGGELQAEVWASGLSAPAWGTTGQGITLTLPSGWAYRGTAAWYAGHLPSNGTLSYSNEYAGATTAQPIA